MCFYISALDWWINCWDITASNAVLFFNKRFCNVGKKLASIIPQLAVKLIMKIFSLFMTAMLQIYHNILAQLKMYLYMYLIKRRHMYRWMELAVTEPWSKVRSGPVKRKEKFGPLEIRTLKMGKSHGLWTWR